MKKANKKTNDVLLVIIKLRKTVIKPNLKVAYIYIVGSIINQYNSFRKQFGNTL